MAAQQRRLLSAEKGKLSKVDLTVMLRKEGAWEILPLETRTHLYSLLPAVEPGEEPHDVNVNPLNTQYSQYIEEALYTWQEDLKAGRETKKWREQAIQAGHDREAGKFDEVKRSLRKELLSGSAADGQSTDSPRAYSEVEESHKVIGGGKEGDGGGVQTIAGVNAEIIGDEEIRNDDNAKAVPNTSDEVEAELD